MRAPGARFPLAGEREWIWLWAPFLTPRGGRAQIRLK
jgi:hypothetical protein